MHVGTTLQRSTGRALPLWDQVFAARAWRSAVGSRPVHVAAEPASARLMAARAGRTEDLGPCGPGGCTVRLDDAEAPQWLWVAGAEDVRWWIEDELTLPQVTAVVPTFRRERDAAAQAEAFARMDCVARVLVVDQGGTLGSFAPLTALRERHEKIELLSQENLGGSGGYARGMLASLEDPSQAVLLSDDDALISEESLRRILTFQTLAEAPTIMGTGLLAADQPGVLLAHSEHVDPATFFWRPADGMRGPLRLDETTPQDWDALMPRQDADYTGWWGTLLPPGAVGALGLPAPFFLKWDDAEYGLRATRRGFATAVLPGASVSHPSWDAYRTQMSWSARILHRNRLATAAAYGAGGGVLVHALVHQIKHVLSGLHLTAELWDAGARAALAGPEHWLGSDLERARTDGQRIVEASQRVQAPRTRALSPTRTAPFSLPAGALRALRRALTPSRAPRAILELPADRLSWRTALGADAVILTSASGERIDAFTVDGHDDRALLRRVVGTQLRLALRWASLRRRYQRALPGCTTEAAWQEILERSGGGTAGAADSADASTGGAR